MNRLGSGFKPAGDFTLPSKEDMEHQTTTVIQAREVPASSATTANEKGSHISDPVPDHSLQLVLNKDTFVVHVQNPDEPGRTLCPFWWSQSRARVEIFNGSRDEVPEYVECP
eukprot:12408833-Karenia_brevis.AAC.1